MDLATKKLTGVRLSGQQQVWILTAFIGVAAAAMASQVTSFTTLFADSRQIPW
jgi:hypothetical protein